MNFKITFIIIIIILNILNGIHQASVPLHGTDEHVDGAVIRTVPWGSTVVLKCLSNDNYHNFFYWHIVNKKMIVGPANIYDKAKYRFEILSGNLTIKKVSKVEEGLYECVSRAVKGEGINIKVVKLIVQRDVQDVYEHDYNINLIRILIALITLVLIAMAGWFVYRIWKDRYRYPSYLREGIDDDDDDDDESTEEIFSQPSTSTAKQPVTHIIPGKKMKREKEFDDVDISTDFKSIMDNVNGN